MKLPLFFLSCLTLLSAYAQTPPPESLVFEYGEEVYKLNEVYFHAPPPQDSKESQEWIKIAKDETGELYSEEDSTLAWKAVRQNPVAYVSGATPYTSAFFTIECDNGGQMQEKKIYAYAKSPDGYHLPTRQLQKQTDGSYYYPKTAATKAFTKEKVDYFESYKLQWFIAFSESGPWQEIAVSDNYLYVTWKAPLINQNIPMDDKNIYSEGGYFRVHHSSINFACKYAKGKKNADPIVDRIFDYFKETKCQDLAGDELTYWGNKEDSYCTILEKFFAGNDGTCGTWEVYMNEMIRIQGIPASYIAIRPSPTNFSYNDITSYTYYIETLHPGYKAYIYHYTTPNGNTIFPNNFFVKNWDYDKFIFLENVSSVYAPSAIFAKGGEEEGKRGQNNPDPISIFNDHAFVVYKAKNLLGNENVIYYDPSYGLKVNPLLSSATQKDYEDEALDLVKGMVFYLVPNNPSGQPIKAMAFILKTNTKNVQDNEIKFSEFTYPY
ncbi:MAG: hypothetical protein R2798_07960 [Chitinophagales bacterium]|nr:hypothetical protein [Bacteroidota bacterium]MCB9042367.1 hypothetical protein [Chitinophagales bacterium]